MLGTHCFNCGYVRMPMEGQGETCPRCNQSYTTPANNASAVPTAIGSDALKQVEEKSYSSSQANSLKPNVNSNAHITRLSQGGGMSEWAVKGLDEKFCSECGAIIKLRAEICPKCGVRQMVAPAVNPLGATTSSGKNKVVAAMFALFLGGIGMHKFYLGEFKKGVFYILFCWTFIPAILGLVAAIELLLMSDKKFVEKYGEA